MVKVLSFRLQKCFNPFAMLSVEGPLNYDLLDIYLTTFFGALNFGNPSAMRVTFFGKCVKFNIDFNNAKKNSEKVFGL